ncbi:hypothetical protein ABGB19_23945 [Mycobacterium sp. B14F4]|uniref:hypothetical protein n=1 Tax=Mycobacterium sp. B14F4 TaxID=3153565 RepID=UPI00325E5AEC
MAHDRLKTFAAAIGGSAIIMLAAFGVTWGERPDGTAVATSNMTVGVTSTQTTPSNVPATGVARPTIKGPAPLPSEEEATK